MSSMSWYRASLVLASLAAPAIAASCSSSSSGDSASPTGTAGSAGVGGSGGAGGTAPAAGGAAGSGGSAGAAHPIPPVANAVTADDPLAEGQFHFLYDTFGTEGIGGWPPTDFMLGLMTSEPDVFGNQFASFGLLPDPNDDLPIGFKRGLGDPTKVRDTCAICHVGKLPDGRLWFGAPNVTLDLSRFKVEVNKRWVAAGNPTLMSDLSIQKSLAMGPGRTEASSDSYPKPVAADFPAYFDFAKRTHFNYLGTGRTPKSEIYLSIFTNGAGDPNTGIPFPTDSVDSMVAFMSSFVAPVGPAQDPAAVTAGRAAFEKASCNSCHHDDVSLDDVVTVDKTPGAKELLPGADAMFPRGSITTDPLHRVLQDGDPTVDAGGGDMGYGDLVNFILKNKLKVGTTDGYRTLDLHGIWATAPYLHNGSVPTLDDLLNPASMRPATFSRSGFTVDTTMEGSSNEGHEFGVDLTAAEKTALVAYLKSL